MAGRTMNISHKGQRLTVCEGQDDKVEFRIGKHRETPKAKSFNAAVKEAAKWMLDHASDVDESRYER